MTLTGRQFTCTLNGRAMRVLNQYSPEWSHPYQCAVDPDDTLRTAGCGVFSLCHAVEWMSGLRLRPEALADFSMQNGGRIYDGTDRPALLRALCEQGEAEKLGFTCDVFENIEDRGALWAHLSEEGGAALCNLRPGHIVTLLAARESGDEKQVLALDSHPSDRQADQFQAIRAVVPGSEIVYPTLNKRGVQTGWGIQAAAYWVPLSLAKSFNLLASLRP